MAKCTGALGSLDTSGKFGNMIVFAKWKGRQYARLLVTPMNPKSAGQALNRSYVTAAGKALSLVLTRKKDTDAHVGSIFFEKAAAAAPAGQSWMSWAMKEILGTNNATIADSINDYAALQATPKGYYDAAASAMGLSDQNVSYGTQDDVKAGAMLYALARFASDYLQAQSDWTFAGGIASPTAQELSMFCSAITVTD